MSYAHRIDGTRPISLRDYDANDTQNIKRDEGEARAAELASELTQIQELLYAASQLSVLIVLQGRDTSGKDGTIRFLTSPINSLGCDVASFKVPTEEEQAHDFLWRVHKQTPARGMMRIFNRSHYEDVLVVRVHNLVDEKIWRARYSHINNFEQLLSDSNTLIFKFYLHIDRDEQEKRLSKREADATKSWKLSVGDWREREFWNDYTKAYEDAINHCSTKRAAWHIVAANKKWFRNLAIAETLVDALKPYKDDWMKALEARGRDELKKIAEFRNAQKK